MTQYAIINIETIQERIEELEKIGGVITSHLIKELKQILSQSTPLIPEISKAYDAGIKDKELSQMFDNPKGRYVYNLKLDI